jgi:hypothetical protein
LSAPALEAPVLVMALAGLVALQLKLCRLPPVTL